MLENIKIVLVRTFHPGNIGSAARAMKTMGLSDLCLVAPKDFPSDESLKMARSAADLVTGATLVDSVYEAVKDCHVVVASTARQRGYDLPELTPEESAAMLNSYAAKASASGELEGKVALLFGPERMGLNNEDLQYAQYRATIPTSPDYPSLNIAAAVQTLCYEIFKGFQAGQGTTEASVTERPSIEEIELFYQHLEDTLSETGFIFKKHPGEIMQKFRNLFSKAELTSAEMNILRGMLASMQRTAKGHEKSATQPQ